MALFDPSAVVDAIAAVFGQAAVYKPKTPGAAAVGITVTLRSEDRDLAAIQGALLARRALIVVRAADFPISPPAKGDRIALGAQLWEVANEPEQADPDRLTWQLRCKPAS